MTTTTIIEHHLDSMRIGGGLQQCRTAHVLPADAETPHPAQPPKQRDDLRPATGLLVGILVGSSIWLLFGMLIAAGLALR